ncbi:MAG: hypothetical protein UY70_C0033G0011 [Candidatus Kaiserbacteria bacterium GW2011_GWB1_52_6]|uniref:Uncharacterized protein n=1 Tax=Candidatus Kaiserbacteria bacterium GW2011_GWB1_52_6 TaxID=1618674 RepID=A0A0G2A233_9BACT|nr:MAG: hypothetical protein UY70_C0033G0011 [Candidatus Kaiserbacteria bacterium GW2011_GWB1_52_6]
MRPQFEGVGVREVAEIRVDRRAHTGERLLGRLLLASERPVEHIEFALEVADDPAADRDVVGLHDVAEPVDAFRDFLHDLLFLVEFEREPLIEE